MALLLGFFRPRERLLRMKRSDESEHAMLIGDTGTGKTTLMYQYLDYIEAIGDVAVILDSKPSFIQRYYNRRRGDWVLDPTDDRVPYWNLGREVRDQSDSLSIALSMLPSDKVQVGADRYFHEGSLDILAYLLETYHPTCEDLGNWLADIDQIDQRIQGTRLVSTLSKNALPQRAGFLSTLNKIGRPLQMMPPDADASTRRHFQISEWVKKRNGWIFLPNASDTREAMRPLLTMWIDLLILRAMRESELNNRPRIWFLLDELYSLNKLPQLATGTTELRACQSPMVLGVQNLAQIREAYGADQSRTIISQAKTKFILATSEPESAKLLSDFVGDHEYDKLRETISSQPGRFRSTRTRSIERVREPLISSAEISSLAAPMAGSQPLEAYFLQRGYVVKIDFAPRSPAVIAAANIPRTIPRPAPFAPSTDTSDDDESSTTVVIAIPHPGPSEPPRKRGIRKTVDATPIK